MINDMRSMSALGRAALATLFFATMAAAQSGTQPAVINNNFGYVGCFNDLVNGVRTVNTIYNLQNMTLESCVTQCLSVNNGNALVMGTEGASNCYCGTS